MHHVLLVEDDAVLRASLIRALQDVADFSISGVGYLAEAVRAIDAHTPSLLIADLELPDGIGLDLLPELAARGLKVPVVFITAHHARFSAELPTNPSVQILTKPFDPEELRAVVLQRLSEVGDQEPAFAVSDYLQLAGMAKRSVRIQVTRGAQELGEIVVMDGEPRWASDQLGQGEPAFRRLALLPRATVTCQTLSGPLTETNLTGSLEHLLIDAARQADEGRRNPAGAETTAVAASAPGRVASPRVPRPPLPPRPSEARLRALADSTAPTSPPPAFKANPQEKVVNLTKSKTNAQQVLALDPSLKTFARADRQGSVLELAGELDAETACAVATMASREVADVASELGLGKAHGWQLSFAGSTWYVVLGRDELVLGQGTANKNPGSLLKKLTKTCGA